MTWPSSVWHSKQNSQTPSLHRLPSWGRDLGLVGGECEQASVPVHHDLTAHSSGTCCVILLSWYLHSAMREYGRGDYNLDLGVRTPES